MLTRTEDIAASVENWLSEFEGALASKNGTALKALFHDESYWRDVLAFTWEIKTITGVGAIAAELKSCSIEAQPTGFAITSARTPPRRVSRAVVSAGASTPHTGRRTRTQAPSRHRASTHAMNASARV